MNRRELFQMTLGSALTVTKSAGGTRPDQGPIRTGIQAFDDLTGGLPPGSLTVLDGQYKGGRTTFLMNVAEHVALEEKRPVLYLLQAFSAPTLLGEIASSRARVDWLDVRGKAHSSRCGAATRGN